MTGALAPYQVLDLTTSRGWLTGRMLGDLGADVVKVEPPGGDPGRLRGPFADDGVDPEANLGWWCFNRGKRGITIDLARADGRDLLRRLVAEADVLVESFDPGRMAAWGLGYDDLAAINPRLVYTSVTPFGQEGPYADFAGPDLVLSAMGGPMWLTGERDRPPVRISVPQYELHGAAEAAVATMIALYHVAGTGEGQHVDVAAQLATIRTIMNASAFPFLEHQEVQRQGREVAHGHARFRMLFACADGHVSVLLAGGALGGMIVKALLGWIAETEGLPDWLAGVDWTGLDFAELAQSEDGRAFFARVSAAIEGFFLSRTKAELYAEALARKFLLAPVNTVADIRVDEQLAARGFFVEVDHPERGGPVTYPGPWARLSATPLVHGRRAPTVGEHNHDVLGRLEPGGEGPGPRRLARDGVTEGRQVFDGLKVWDMSWVGVGPLTARYLADHGATVVRLDTTKRPDVLRLTPPFLDGEPGINRSHFYADYNASKLGIGLDVEHPLGREVALRLVDWCDVLLESFTPKTMAAWGMSYTELAARNPSMVMLSTCMQGQTGPRRDYRGFGNLMAALSGFYEICGYADRDPVPIYGAYTDFVCQRFATTALIAALDHRRRTGEGQHIDLAQYEAALQFLGPQLLDLEVNGRVATRRGNRSDDACPHGVYPTRPVRDHEGWIAIACETDEQWLALRRVMGDPAWAASDRLATLAGRKAAEDDLDARLGAWTAGWEQEALFAALQPEVPAGMVHDQTGLHADAQVVHRGYFVTLEHTEMGPVPYDGLQARLSATPGRLTKAAPCVGEDTWLVLEELLGMDPDEIADLIAAEAVEIT